MFSHGYGSAAWLTVNQAKHLGGHVRKGEHETPIVFAREAEKETETGEKEKYHFLRFFTVFNIYQVEGLPDHMTGLPTPRPLDAAFLEAEAFIARLGADFRHGSGYAAYSPMHDCILMPYQE